MKAWKSLCNFKTGGREMYADELPRFIVDNNVGKLAKWLRMIGYDTQLFDQHDEKYLIHSALIENRIIITRDTGIMQRRVITIGKIKVLLILSDNPHEQIRQVITELKLNPNFKTFTLCLECNVPLTAIRKEEIEDRVPPYVYRTQSEYVECPSCHRIYWKGTHWLAMIETLKGFCQQS
jgi:hypothetical protein